MALEELRLREDSDTGRHSRQLRSYPRAKRRGFLDEWLAEPRGIGLGALRCRGSLSPGVRTLTDETPCREGQSRRLVESRNEMYGERWLLGHSDLRHGLLRVVGFPAEMIGA